MHSQKSFTYIKESVFWWMKKEFMKKKKISASELINSEKKIISSFLYRNIKNKQHIISYSAP